MTVEEEVRALRKIIVGNGELGLAGRVHSQEHLINGIRHDLTENTKKLDQVMKHQQSEIDRREGSRNTLNWIKWGLAVLVLLVSIGGGLGMYQLTNQWQTVQQQIQRIPALPE